jgi:predicted Fe-Mo cluster-binding NifX family protein
MRIGLTVWGNRISPVFDASRTLMVAEIEGNRVVGKNYISMQPGFPHHQIGRLIEQQIETLICGAISEVPAHMADASGILLIPFITGNVEDVLNAYLSGRLGAAPMFRMPGFRRGQHRRRRGRFR